MIKVPYERWWQTMEEGSYPGVDGYFVHPVLDDAVMAGNGTIGLELVEDLDAIDTVLVPVGRRRPDDRDRERARRRSAQRRACSPASPRRARRSPRRSRPASPVEVDYTPSFVDGAGSKALLAADVGARPAARSPAPSR